MYGPQEVADTLEIKPVTLRKWSSEFAAFLGDSARHAITPGGGAAARRYSDSDVQVLQRVKQLLPELRTYERVRRQLASEFRARPVRGQQASGSAPPAGNATSTAPPDPDDPPPDGARQLARSPISTQEVAQVLALLQSTLEQSHTRALAAKDNEIDALRTALTALTASREAHGEMLDAHNQTIAMQHAYIEQLRTELERVSHEKADLQQSIVPWWQRIGHWLRRTTRWDRRLTRADGQRLPDQERFSGTGSGGTGWHGPE